MVIEKVFGLSSTAISLNDRFTILSTSSAVTNTARKPITRASPARRASDFNGHLYSDVEVPRHNVKQRLRSLAAINALKHQAWQYGLIRQALLRGRLSQSNIKNRLGKRGIGRGIRFRWNRVIGTQAQRLQLARRYRAFNQRGRGRARGQGVALQASQQSMPKQTARRGRPFVRGGRGRGRGRGGGVTRQQHAESLSKEQLDKELEQYMSCTKAALDKQLDEYMQDAAMDIGIID